MGSVAIFKKHMPSTFAVDFTQLEQDTHRYDETRTQKDGFSLSLSLFFRKKKRVIAIVKTTRTVFPFARLAPARARKHNLFPKLSPRIFIFPFFSWTSRVLGEGKT